MSAQTTDARAYLGYIARRTWRHKSGPTNATDLLDVAERWACHWVRRYPSARFRGRRAVGSKQRRQAGALYDLLTRDREGARHLARAAWSDHIRSLETA
ncbi:MAG: hypothetical protein AAFV53_35415 [Myxococcota bacterium]